MKSEDAETQRAAGGALGNLAENENNKRLIVEIGGLEPIIRQMGSPNVEVQCNAVGALTNLAICDENKSKIAASGALVPLINLAKSNDRRVQRNATGALLNMTHSKDNRKKLIDSGALPVLVSLMASTDKDVQYYSLTAVSNLAVDRESRVMLDKSKSRIIPCLTKLISTQASEKVRCQTVFVMRNLASEETFQYSLVKYGVLPYLKEIFISGSNVLKIAASACLFNISMHPMNEEAILGEGLIEPLSSLIKKFEEEELITYVISTLRNLASTSDQSKLQIASSEVLQNCKALLPSASDTILSVITAFLAIMALGEEVKPLWCELDFIEDLLPLAISKDNKILRGNSSAAIGNLSGKLHDFTPFIAHWSEPAGGIRALLLDYLSSDEPTSEHIALWTVVQLLESENTKLITKIRETREILELVKTLAKGRTLEQEMNEGSDAVACQSRRAVLSLANKAVSLYDP